ncbi:MAG: ABC transporter substrate-binding protein [Deltaproteobacteria bacterium]|nr:ABC transporter substrate-binding protein [Deltaproteobacteria bacterium]
MHRYIYGFILSAFFIFTFPAAAGELLDDIKRATDKLITVVSDEKLLDMEHDAERRKLIREAVDEIFDWEAFSRRALGRHWRGRTDNEKKEFIELFGKLLERTYMDKTRQYSGEKAIFLKEIVDGDYGVAETSVLTSDGKEVEVIYRAQKKEGKWRVYDVQVEGVSFVNNYRVQFNDIITKSSYAELVRRLNEKIEPE